MLSRRLAVLLYLILFALHSRAQQPVTLDQVQHPGLLLKTNQPGVFLEAPTVSTEISLSVRGIVARGLVRQTFENATDHCVEAIYVFPLSDNATVDAMRMRIGVRTIEGQIREREEAQREYEEAKSEGRNASLLEQHRPNLFTVSVASLASHETAQIELEYQEIVRYDDGKFSLRVPLAIGPRYNASNLPVPPSSGEQNVNPVTINIDLDSGITLATVKSPTHDLESTRLSGTHVTLKPRKVSIASDRDFILEWTPQLGALPQSTQFSEVVGDDRYTLLMLFPPDVSLQPKAILPRETIFIIDTSGSMGGPSIEQAKKALLTAIGRLRASDRFNVIEFNSDAHRLFDESRPADVGTVAEALRWVAALESTGGTEMMSALKLALDDAPHPNDIRQVIFMTDGQVGNEADVFAYIREHLGGSRLFTIGIGNAPNTYFMSNAARAGRGTFTQIGDLGEVEEKMTAIFQKLESPVLSNISVQFADQTSVVPDLYAGEPLVVTLRSSSKGNANGRITANGWNGTFAPSSDEHANGIAKLWARREIDAVRDSVFTGAKEEDVRAKIVSLALAHHLVTEHTSLVAVDTTPAGVDARSCKSELVPVNLPAGWGGVEGALPQTGTNAKLLIAIGVALLLLAWRVARA
ncbi:MAG TPA: VIT domain-containing protein [Thermoanaerobaculia bacterium]|nr:VIT domain-containing protein [Thermoanaerobaculia bacterium]